MIIPIINPDLLRQVRDRINKVPSKFLWTSWCVPLKPGDPNRAAVPCAILDESCGTSCCIGGWAVVLACPAGMRLMDFYWSNPGDSMEDKAYELLLGKRPQEGTPAYEHWRDARWALKNFLFYPWGTPDKNGCALRGDPGGDGEQWLREATARINWVLDGKDTSDYIIAVPELIYTPQY